VLDLLLDLVFPLLHQNAPHHQPHVVHAESIKHCKSHVSISNVLKFMLEVCHYMYTLVTILYVHTVAFINSIPCPSQFIPGKGRHLVPTEEGWVGPRASLDKFSITENPKPPPDIKPRTVHPITSHYTDYALLD
jgi:hypothetical protein